MKIRLIGIVNKRNVRRRCRILCAIIVFQLIATFAVFIVKNSKILDLQCTKLALELPPFPAQGARNIFFVETSCAITNTSTSNFVFSSGLVLPPRAACAMESAAVAHPKRPVYLVHSCPVDKEDPLRGAPPYARALFALPNVFLWNAPYDLNFQDSPLEGLVASGVLRESKWPESHASDILRYFLLWKYGGTYLDTDVLMLRSFGVLRDFSCAESVSQVSAGAMDFSWERPGRVMAEECLQEVLKFKPKVWVANGPGVITRSMQAVCGVRNISKMATDKCQGFQLLPTAAIYPVFYTKWRLIFHSNKAAEAMKAIKGSYAIHVWNWLSQGERVNTSSDQAYAQIARRVCPAVIAHAGRFM